MNKIRVKTKAIDRKARKMVYKPLVFNAKEDDYEWIVKLDHPIKESPSGGTLFSLEDMKDLYSKLESVSGIKNVVIDMQTLYYDDDEEEVRCNIFTLQKETQEEYEERIEIEEAELKEYKRLKARFGDD